MIRNEFVDVNGIRMHYATAGEGDPILLLHGFPEYWGVWKKVMADLSRSYRVIAPDLRGYNLTSRPVEVDQYHIQHLVGDIRSLLDALGLVKTCIVAQDWGAVIAWSLLLRHPEYVERFVTINVTHPAIFDELLQGDAEQQKASQYMLTFRAPAAEEMLSADDFAALRHLVFEDARRHGAELVDADVEAWVDTWRQPGALTAGLNYYRAAEIGPPAGLILGRGGSNLLDDLSHSRFLVYVPVMAIWGDKDLLLLENGLDRLHRLVMDLRIVKVRGATHWVTLERPALVCRFIREFYPATW